MGLYSVWHDQFQIHNVIFIRENKYQVVTTPYDMMFHMSNPVVGRQNYWYMYMKSGLDKVLPAARDHNGRRYFIYGDPGYNIRWYLETPFERPNISADQQ